MTELHTIYRIFCVKNGKSYIGRSMQVEDRQKYHFAHLRLNNHHSKKLQYAYNKHGANNFKFEVLQTAIGESDINRSEIAWIEWFDSYYNGYNETLGGDSPPVHRRGIVWDGIEYPSVSAAARAIGVKREAMNARVRAGHRSTSDVLSGHRDKPYEYNGILYKSITAAANANSLSHSGMQKRIKRGYKKDSDIPGNSASHSNPCSWNGIQYPSIKAMGKALGISGVAARKRLAKGHTCDADMSFRRK